MTLSYLPDLPEWHLPDLDEWLNNIARLFLQPVHVIDKENSILARAFLAYVIGRVIQARIVRGSEEQTRKLGGDEIDTYTSPY
jgi:hypothetical protein